MTQNKLKKVKAFAPASVANVACGFDVLGFAISGPGDFVEAEFSDNPGVTIETILNDDGRLPLDPEQNTAGKAILALLEETGEERGISIRIEKKMPLGSGLGSSASSAVAAVVAVNELIGNPYEKKDLLPFALQGEMVASGTPHADNISASLLGGFILVRSHNPPDVVSLPVPDKLMAVVIHPHIEINTKSTRLILRKSVPLSKAVEQWGNVGAFVAGLYSGDYGLISRSLYDDIIEPSRSILIPGFGRMKQAAMDQGALGFSISGAGPSVFALCDSKETAKKIGESAGKILEETELGYDIYISEINKEGSVVISKEEE